MLESPPVTNVDTAMHMNDVVGTPHVRLYPRETVRIWSSADSQRNVSSLAVDIWISAISRFWAMHNNIMKGRTEIILTGVDSSLPRPYKWVLDQIPDQADAIYAMTIFFTITYNMQIPSDIDALWQNYLGKMDSPVIHHHYVWWFFNARAKEIRNTASYRYLVACRDIAISRNITPISPRLHKRIKASEYNDKFIGYGIVECDSALDAIMRLKRREDWDWVVADMTTMTIEQSDVDDIFDRLRRTDPKSDHALIRCTQRQLRWFPMTYMEGFQIVIYPMYHEHVGTAVRLNMEYQFLRHALEVGQYLIYEHPFSNYVGKDCKTIVLTPETIG
jgi:hypothetical protein